MQRNREAEMTGMEKAAAERFYGLTEIARASGIDRRLLALWLQRGKLPEPDARLAMGPVWTAQRIEPWIRGKAGVTP